jgi:hypothetical protein
MQSWSKPSELHVMFLFYKFRDNNPGHGTATNIDVIHTVTLYMLSIWLGFFRQ